MCAGPATGSGSLGGITFVNAAITFTQTADTNNVVRASMGTSVFYSVQALTSTVAVAGIGTTSFTAPTFTASQTNFGLGTAGAGGPSLINVSNAAAGSYDLRTSIGPLTGAANLTLKQA